MRRQAPVVTPLGRAALSLALTRIVLRTPESVVRLPYRRRDMASMANVEHLGARQAARGGLADAVSRVQYDVGTRVVLTRRGQPAAALVPVADLARLQKLDIERDGICSAGELVELVSKALDGGGAPVEEE